MSRRAWAVIALEMREGGSTVPEIAAVVGRSNRSVQDVLAAHRRHGIVVSTGRKPADEWPLGKPRGTHQLGQDPFGHVPMSAVAIARHDPERAMLAVARAKGIPL